MSNISAGVIIKISAMNGQTDEHHYKEPKAHIGELTDSCEFEDKSLKSLLPQIAAAFIVMSYGIVSGISFGYSAILIPQLLEEQETANSVNSTKVVINASESELSWIASVLPTAVLPTSLIAGTMIDYLGRLNTMKISAIPSAIGWVLIALATNVPMLIIGRILTGTAMALGVSQGVVYVTEISSPSIRGALTAISTCLVSLGMMLAYLEGWLFNWRTVAWSCLGYTIVPIFIILWLPESPAWLVSKNKLEEAKKSLDWINRYRTDNNKTISISESQLLRLQKDHMMKQEHFDKNQNHVLKMLKMSASPNVYKPFIFITVLYIFQQFSGLFVLMFYAVSFFMEVGTEMSAYLAAVLIGAVRFGMSILTVFLMKRFRRRFLIMASGIGMAISIGISGLFTDLITEGKTTLNWIPVAMILLYVASSVVGFLGIPWLIIGELFPTEVRGIGYSICFGVANLIMFASIKLYFPLIRLFGGMAGLQYFFAAISLFGVVYSYVFLPETHNKQLMDIEEHFKHSWTYLSVKDAATESNKNKKEGNG